MKKIIRNLARKQLLLSRLNLQLAQHIDYLELEQASNIIARISRVNQL